MLKTPHWAMASDWIRRKIAIRILRIDRSRLGLEYIGEKVKTVKCFE
jgi:hypothetical protein